MIASAPWQVVWFSISLYIVVYKLKNAGLTDYLSVILKELNTSGDTIAILGTGFIAAFLSAIMNNFMVICHGKKGVKIGFWEYSKFGLLVTSPILLLVLLSL